MIPQTLACKYLEKLSNNQVYFFDFVYSLSLYIVLMQGDCTMATDRLIPWRDASWFEPQWMLKNAFKTSLDSFFREFSGGYAVLLTTYTCRNS